MESWKRCKLFHYCWIAITGIFTLEEIISLHRNDSWNNSAFSSEEAEALNEGTYLTNLIVPAIRASLKNLPHGKFTYIST